MTLAEPFSYELPIERIAQRPVVPYHDARLLAVNRTDGTTTNSTYREITRHLDPSDVLIFNDSRVIPARLLGTLGKGSAEVLLLRKLPAADEQWLCTGKPLRKFKPGATLAFACGLGGVVEERISEREVRILFRGPATEPVPGLIRRVGLMPIPPYIRRGQSDERDRTDYQTFFAKYEGSIAAPTASLHFTPELFSSLAAHGNTVEYLTLHVGAASIAAAWENGAFHPPQAERFVCNQALLTRLRRYRGEGRRLVAVGTTVVRALESMACADRAADGEEQDTTLFIRPGYEFKLVDVLVTNFHQPGTSHLLLVEAFMRSRDLLNACYKRALDEEFRFLSYGDGMLIW